MSPLISLGCRLGLLALVARSAWADCLAYGIDFQNGGSYFQNSASSDSFDFVTQFEGCQPDVCYNILVDPQGDQYQCSDTRLTPDDTNQLSTCPLKKSQLGSGDWSVILISNDGNGDPIAYERDFSLSVGPQSTVTYTPTVTASTVTTPIINQTTTTTDTSTSVLPPITVTSPSTTVKPTVTITPARVTTTKTVTLLTLKITDYTLSIAKATKTETASCKTPKRASTPDPKATIKATLGPAATVTGVKLRRTPGPRAVVDFDKDAFVAARSERLGRDRLEGRAPDAQPLTVTDTNTQDWITATQTSTAAAVTLTQTTNTIVTTTSTPPPVTVLSGQTTQIVTVTAPTPTKTHTKVAVAISVVTTKTIATTVTITTRTTPAALITACKSAGGTIVK